VVSELVTNALRYGRPPRDLTLSLIPCTGESRPSDVQIDVFDADARLPVQRDGGDDGGFGLQVAKALTNLSVHPQSTGKTVRALLPLNGINPEATTPARRLSVRPDREAPTTEAAHRPPIDDETKTRPIQSNEREVHVDLIEIEALRLRCVIGCSAEERRDRSDVVIDLRIGIDAQSAGDSDALADAWNYRTPVKAVIALVEASAYRTVEALAVAIARILVVDHGAPQVRVRVHKPGTLRFADSVGVVVERTPADFTPGEYA
jgi:FolB domain-containing protein